jgi:hypothetical protein
MRSCGGSRKVTDENNTRMLLASSIIKATNKHSEYVILFFHGNNGFAKALQCYVRRILRVLFGYFWIVEISSLTLRTEHILR